MTNRTKDIAVSEAIKVHTAEPYDAGHDLIHHEAVWRNCQQTIDQIKVLETIDSHSFGNKQITPEQKVLFDADKLEYVSVDRFKKVAKAVKTGKMNQEVFDKYKKAWEEIIPQVARLMHFDSSKKIFQERLSEIRKLVKTNKIWSGLVLPPQDNV